MPAILDDLDTRPGSATSLLRTLIGGTLRMHGGWMSSAALVDLLAAVDVPGDRARMALTRMKTKGLLTSQASAGVPGYAVTEEAVEMLERGDRRIFEPRFMVDGDRWCLISFTVPEAQRELRRRLRLRLGWIGCGTVAPALWICPEYLSDEVDQIVRDLKLSARVTVFLADEIRMSGKLQAAVATWWDLGALRALHDAFLDSHASAPDEYRASPQPRTAFRLWTAALDAWRPIPYLDPGLPLDLLPSDWPGSRSIPLFLELRDRLSAPAAEHVRDVIAVRQPGHAQAAA